MKITSLIGGTLFLFHFTSAQFAPYVEIETVHCGPCTDPLCGSVDLTGFVSYRVYATMNPEDCLAGVIGNEIIITFDSLVYNHQSSSVFIGGPDCVLFPFFPCSQWDSYLSMCDECETGDNLFVIGQPGDNTGILINESGCEGLFSQGEFFMNDPGIFFVPDASTCMLAGKDGSVLIAQFTTNGGFHMEATYGYTPGCTGDPIEVDFVIDQENPCITSPLPVNVDISSSNCVGPPYVITLPQGGNGTVSYSLFDGNNGVIDGAEPLSDYSGSNGALFSDLSEGCYYLNMIDEIGCCASAEIVCSNSSDSAFWEVDMNYNFCEGDSAFILGEWISSDGIYSEIITNEFSCDSIIHHIVSVIPDSEFELTYEICDGDSVFVLGEWISSPGIYDQIITGALSCDSILHHQIVMGDNPELTLSYEICDGDSMLINDAWHDEAGTFTWFIDSEISCDTIVTATLSIIDLPLQPGISVNTEGLLFCDEVGDEYTWTIVSDNCGTINIITNSPFLDLSDECIDENYTVVVMVTSNGCNSAWSVPYVYSGIEQHFPYNVIVYPNPVDGIVYVIWGENGGDERLVSIYNSNGKIIKKEKGYGNIKVDAVSLSPGYYALVIENGFVSVVRTFIKK